MFNLVTTHKASSNYDDDYGYVEFRKSSTYEDFLLYLMKNYRTIGRIKCYLDGKLVDDFNYKLPHSYLKMVNDELVSNNEIIFPHTQDTDILNHVIFRISFYGFWNTYCFNVYLVTDEDGANEN